MGDCRMDRIAEGQDSLDRTGQGRVKLSEKGDCRMDRIAEGQDSLNRTG